MTIRINGIKLSIDHTSIDLINTIEKELQLPYKKVKQFNISKRSLDARKKDHIFFVYQLELDLLIDERKLLQKLNKQNIQLVEPKRKNFELLPGTNKLEHRPIVIGAGPAGLFAALKLAELGYKPLVLERGHDVERRYKDIKHFWSTGELNLNSNVQFGEGGAGTFSDGKLTTRIKDSRIDEVFKVFVENGAPNEILYESKPHIGTDILIKMLKSLREQLLALGATIKFDAQVTKLIVEQGRVIGVEINNEERISTDVVVLAIGHSSRDTYKMLYEIGLELQSKPLAIGARIEHSQKLINTAQYGRYANAPQLGAADYTLIKKAGDTDSDRATYSFCMCPGGVVVAAASEKNAVVTNGMSYFNRASGVANSALVATVSTDDYKGEDPLAGIRYLRKYEEKAYKLGGGGYKAPAQKVGDFLNGGASSDLESSFKPTYRPGLTPSDLHQTLPEFVSKSLETAIIEFGKKLKGYNTADAILTGVETRTSAPVKIPRKEDFQALNIEGLYPTGEGAGYAGGIVSAAVDGLRVAEHIIQTYQRPKQSFGEELFWENISEQME